MNITITAEDLAEVSHLSDSKAAKVLGVAKSTIWKYRHAAKDGRPAKAVKPEAPASGGYRLDVATDGTVSLDTSATDVPQTTSDVDALLRTKGIDPELFTLSYGFSEWESGDRTLHAYRVRATPKRVPVAAAQLDVQELVDAIAAPVARSPKYDPAASLTFVLCPSDMQIGKTSYNGGTDETVARVLGSYASAVEYLERVGGAAHIVIAELGDPLENFNNVSSQRETNDLDLTGQVRVTRRLLLEGIKLLAPFTERLSYVTVPSNHGAVRLGPKAPAGNNHNDWGIEISHQLEDVVGMNDDYAHVEFIRPAHLEESVALDTATGTRLGFVHGHQSKGADKLGTWWAGQDHGRQATADADILLAGHWHSFRVYQSGDARWVMVSPASDPGSDWFTNITGERSTAGMLSFTTADGMWSDLRIL